MKNYIILYLLAFVISISSIEFVSAQTCIQSCDEFWSREAPSCSAGPAAGFNDCINSVREEYDTCLDDCTDAFNAGYNNIVSDSEESSVVEEDTSDIEAEIVKIKAETDRIKAESDELKAKGAKITAETALIKKESDALKKIKERTANKEIVQIEIPCEQLTYQRARDQIENAKERYATNNYAAVGALNENDELNIIVMDDDVLTCYGYIEAPGGRIYAKNQVVETPSKKVAENEVIGKIKVSAGTVKILRDGRITPIGNGYEVRAGDAIKTDKDEIIGIVSKDGLVQLSGDTRVGFIGLEFDPIANRNVISPPPDAPWAADPSSFKLEVDNDAFWQALYQDLVDFHIENPPAHFKSCAKVFFGDPTSLTSCGVDTAAFVYGGVAWFEKKIDEDFPPGIVLTPTAAITTTGTEFTVEVAEDGTTTVTTLQGNVIVTDLTSRNSVFVNTDEQFIVSNLGKPQENVIKVDSESIDKWWNDEEPAQDQTPEIGGFQVVTILLVGLTFWVVLIYSVVKLVKKRKNKK